MSAPTKEDAPWEDLGDDDPGLKNDTIGALLYAIMQLFPGYFGSTEMDVPIVEHYPELLSEDERQKIRQSLL